METRSVFKYNSAVQIKIPMDRIKENTRPWVVNSALEILIFKMWPIFLLLNTLESRFIGLFGYGEWLY